MDTCVPFTQYLRPNGRQVFVTIDVTDGLDQKVRDILDAGLRFECEELSTGQISLTITDPEEGDVDIRVVSNGPGMHEAVEDLITSFAAQVAA